MEVCVFNKKKHLSGEACSLIKRIIALCDLESDLKKLFFPLESISRRATFYAGICKDSVKRIREEANSNGFSYIGTRKGRLLQSFRCMDCLDLAMAASCFRSYYLNIQSNPTFISFLPYIKSKMLFPYGLTTTHKAFNWLGFKAKKTEIGRKTVWVENPDLVSLRCKYLQKIMKFRTENKNIFYLHETWLAHGMTSLKYCQINSLSGNSLKNILIIITITSDEKIMTENFIILNADEIPNNDRDLDHLEIIHDWLKDAIIPRLPENSVVVMEETSYYAVQSNQPPRKYSCKSEMFKWLSENNVPCSLDMNKFELYDLVVAHPSKKYYNIEELFSTNGHTVVRFPPLTWDLNPVEWVFTKVKGIIEEKSIGKELQRNELRQLTEDALSELKMEDLSFYCNHVHKLEEEHWKRDGLIEDLIDSIVLSMRGELDSDEERLKYDLDSLAY